MDVKQLVVQALQKAVSCQFEGLSGGALHRARSSSLVESLADTFRSQYANDQSVRVFSRQNAENRPEFGLNELLHDVCVCRVGEVPSAVQRKGLPYIQEVLWQVESEFAKNSRETLKDFNKLVCGSAKHKLFVGSQVTDNEGSIDALLPAARACSGEVAVALLPHPDEWDAPPLKVRLWQLLGDAWLAVGPDESVW